MSAEPRFVDTNVLVYLFDSGAPDKQTRARDLLREEQDRLVVSVQVLGEFYVTVTSFLIDAPWGMSVTRGHDSATSRVDRDRQA